MDNKWLEFLSANNIENGRPMPGVTVCGYFQGMFDEGWYVCSYNDDPAYKCWVLHNVDPNCVSQSQRKDDPLYWIYLPKQRS